MGVLDVVSDALKAIWKFAKKNIPPFTLVDIGEKIRDAAKMSKDIATKDIANKNDIVKSYYTPHLYLIHRKYKSINLTLSEKVGDFFCGIPKALHVAYPWVKCILGKLTFGIGEATLNLLEKPVKKVFSIVRHPINTVYSSFKNLEFLWNSLEGGGLTKLGEMVGLGVLRLVTGVLLGILSTALSFLPIPDKFKIVLQKGISYLDFGKKIYDKMIDDRSIKEIIDTFIKDEIEDEKQEEKGREKQMISRAAIIMKKIRAKIINIIRMMIFLRREKLI